MAAKFDIVSPVDGTVRQTGLYLSEAEALEAIDFDTIGLLLGMMLLAALLEPTGFFQYIAVKAGCPQLRKPRCVSYSLELA